MRRTLWIAAVVALALVVALLVQMMVGGDDDAPVAAPGEAFKVLDAEILEAKLSGDQVEVQLPWVAVTLTVGEERSALPAEGGDTGVPVAPEDGGFLPVRVETRSMDANPVSVADWTEDYAWPTAQLTIDGSATRLPGVDAYFGLAGSSSMTWYVATEGDPEDIEFSVTLGDRTETFDLRDPEEHVAWADEFDHETVTTKQLPCEQETWTAGYDNVGGRPLQNCAVESLTTTAYVDGLGWAPTGQEYVLARVNAYPEYTAHWRSQDGRRASYGLGDPRVGFRLDGDPPVRLVGGPFKLDVPTPVFLVPKQSAPRELEVTQTYRGFPNDPGTPTEPLIERTIHIQLDGAGS